MDNYWLREAKKSSMEEKPQILFKRNKDNVLSFPDGTLNVSENCLDIHLGTSKAKQTALITINKELCIERYSYEELYNAVNNLTRFFLQLKSKPKKIMIHSSANIYTTVLMLTLSRIGVEFCILFQELSEVAVLKRIKLFNPDLLFTNLKSDIFKKNYPKVKKKIKIKYLENLNLKFRRSKRVNINHYNADKNLFTLFTSGSTGDPKGIIHSSGGYLTFAKYTTKKQFGANKSSIMLTCSDAGWINGHTYAVFGPLSLGATSVILERPIDIINSQIFKIINDLKVSILYLPVTLIRSLKSIYENERIYFKYIKSLGSMGEPLASSVGKWFSAFFSDGKLPIVNTYFQTETGGIIASQRFNDKPDFGTVGKALNKFIKFNELSHNKKVELKLLKWWPGCMKGVLNGRKEWEKYWDANSFKLFDLASLNKRKNILIHGRTDDVINISGHRIGSGEIENVIMRIKNVNETCVVMNKDFLKGYKVNCLIVSNSSDKDLIKKEVFDSIRNNFGQFALPEKVIITSGIPKTRSGKIMRRVVRNLFENPKSNNYGDLSTILEKSFKRN